MSKVFNPQQTVLFPGLVTGSDLPSITTLPEYDTAIQNFIKMSDYGAFIELNVVGIEKSYSLSLNELQIPRRYRKQQRDIASPIFHLFPSIVRNHLGRLKYDARSFFNKNNSVKTSFGYFLFRQYFYLWDSHRKQYLANFSDYLNREIGEKHFQKYYKSVWSEGTEWLRPFIRRKYQHHLPPAEINTIQRRRERLQAAGSTISQLDRDAPDFFLNGFILKTMHIPITLADYIDGINIQSTFKTIHLEHLKNMAIEDFEDLLALFETLT